MQNRYFGFWRSVSLVVGNIIGSGIFLLPASLGAYGLFGLLGWVITSLGSICLALVFARLSFRFPKTGGPYAYSKSAFGDFIGFQVAWNYWVGTWASNAAISTAFVSYLSELVPVLKTNNALAFCVAFSAVWFFTFINTQSVRSAGILQVFITIAKAIPLICIGIYGIFYIDLSHFTQLGNIQVPPLQALAASSALTLFAFLGLESATIPAEHVLEPEKTIPKATIVGTLFSAVVYIWCTVVLFGILDSEALRHSHAPFADAGALLFGGWAKPFIAFCAAFAAFGTLNGWILVQGQVPLAAAQDGLFPKLFQKQNKNGSPYMGLIVSSILMSGMLFMNYGANLVEQFTTIVNFTTFSVLLPYLYSTVADLYFLLLERTQSKTLLPQIGVTLLAFLYTLLIVVGSGKEAVFLGILFLFSGFPFYAWMKARPVDNISNIA